MGAGAGEVRALLTDDGRTVWSENLSAIRRLDPLADIAQIRGLPVIDRDLVLAVSHGGQMLAVDLRLTVEGSIPPDRVERAIQLSRETYCSVWLSLNPDIEFKTSFEIRN